MGGLGYVRTAHGARSLQPSTAKVLDFRHAREGRQHGHSLIHGLPFRTFRMPSALACQLREDSDQNDMPKSAGRL